MDTESLALIVLLAAATLPLVLHRLRAGSTAERGLLLAGWIGVVGLVAFGAATYPPAHRRPPADQPLVEATDGYTGSDACKACHPDEYASWHRSYHRTMTQVANKDTVLGPVDGVTLEAAGQVFALERRGDEVWVEMDVPGETTASGAARREWRKIVQTTGSHEGQAYWVASGEKRKLSLLPIMYRMLDEQQWAPLEACFITPPNIVQEFGTGRWNRVCSRCHATHGRPRIDDSGMDTHVSELGIACEACHGPGHDHAASYRDPRQRYAQHDSDHAAQRIVNPAKLSKERSSEVCGQCHGINGFQNDEDRAEWSAHGFRYRPGDVLADSRELLHDGEEFFWSDGMVRVSGREYNGLVRSPCYERGEMTCLSCHTMHPGEDDPRSLDEWAVDQLGHGMDGDRACLQCHAEYEDAAVRDAHTHHAPGSAGASCYNCHMPHTTYGLLKGMRSHEVSSPSVQETAQTGRPNACSQCHLDKPLGWVAQQLEEWYGIEPPKLSRDQEVLSAAVQWAVQGDAGQRALTAWSLGWEPAREASGTEWMTPLLLVLMQDPYHAVRYISARTFGQQPEAGKIDYDYMAPKDELFRSVSPAFEAWNAGRAGRERSETLLINARGEFDMERLNQMLQFRDRRPVTLNE